MSVIPPHETDDELAGLLARARRGDEAALMRIAELYGPDLLRVVRRSLPRRLRSVYDSQDFVQAMWATFLRNEIDLNRFGTHGELLAYLSGIVSHKVTQQIRKRLVAQKASLNREVTLSAWGEGQEIAPQRHDTPSAFAMANERMEQLLRGQPEHYRRIIALKASGASAAEIAAALELNEGSVRRILTKASERVKEP